MMFINGQFTSGKSTETIPVINPATEEIIAETRRGTPEDAVACNCCSPGCPANLESDASW